VTSSSETVESSIGAQVAAGVPVATVRATILHMDPRALMTSKDIANVRQSIRRRELSTRTVIEALFTSLTANQFPPPQVHCQPGHHGTAAFVLDASCHLPAVPSSSRCSRHGLHVQDKQVQTPAAEHRHSHGLQQGASRRTVLVARGTEADFVLAQKTLWQLMIEKDIAPPGVIVTDRDLAFMNAVDRVFAGIPAMVCRWHMNKNVVARTRHVLGQVPVQLPAPGQPKYENSWQTNAFLAAFYKAVEVRDDVEFDQKRIALVSMSPSLSEYLDAHWWK